MSLFETVERTHVRVAVLCVALCLAFACGGGESDAPKAPAKPMAPVKTDPKPAAPALTETELPADPKPAAPAKPATTAKIELGDASAGAQHYASLCASCHGSGGAGDGPVSAGLNPKPAAHNDGAYMNALSNEHLYKVIKNGGASVGKSALMAPWGGTLNDDQIRDVVAFVRSLADPPYTGP